MAFRSAAIKLRVEPEQFNGDAEVRCWWWCVVWQHTSQANHKVRESHFA